ncbi:MAG: trypsin-like serine protease [Acidibrevibacterium sp.]|jgi:protease YdgD|nr:trypsin-like serine protease [Acidibrevibacterium fodinaquatile]
MTQAKRTTLFRFLGVMAWRAVALGLLFSVASLPLSETPLAADVQFAEPSPSATILPGIGRNDDRQPVNPADFPWRALGRVQTALGSRCTGFMVGPRTAITAAHCLFRERTRLIIQPRLIHFLLATSRGAAAGVALVADFTIAPGYDPFHESESAGADWAVLTLSAPLVREGEYLRLDRTLPPRGTPALLGGYSKDHIEIIEADLHCLITEQIRDARGGVLLHHTCHATSGTSGAPLLFRLGSGEWRVAGVQIGSVVDHAGGIAVPAAAIPTSAIGR